MGRYYSGDIEGKFWFGVQVSSAADRFGVEGVYVRYDENVDDLVPIDDEDLDEYDEIVEMMWKFKGSDLKYVEEELKEIEETLGENLAILEKFFDINDSYNDEMIIEYFKTEHNKKISRMDVYEYLSEYADLLLGEQIRDAIKENGSCHFFAEI